MPHKILMKPTVSPFFALILSWVIFLSPSNTQAVGTFSTNDYMQIAPTAAQTAVFYDGKKETLLASWTFDFNPLLAQDFYWIIPVPSKPEVENITSDFFAQIEKLSDPESEPETLKTRGVNLLSHKIFEPADGAGNVKTWLFDGGYLFPKRLEPVLEEYMKNGWYVVAVQANGIHIQRDASESLTIDTAHTMPIKITFDTDKIILPFKFASIDPDIDAPASTLFYGVSSEQFLGVKDAQIDALLAKQSLNRFPRLPLGSSNIKLDVFVFNKGGAEVAGFENIKETIIDGEKFQKGSWSAAYLDLPSERLTLTHLEDYRHLGDLGDIEVTEKGGMSDMKSSFAGVGVVSSSAGFAAFLVLVSFFFFLVGAFAEAKFTLLSRASGFFGGYAFATAAHDSAKPVKKGMVAGTFLVFLAVGIGLLAYEARDTISGPGGGDTVAGAAGSMGMAMNMGSGVNGREISMKSGDFFFSSETLKLKVGERVVLHIDSKGRHTFTVKELGINVETPDGKITDVAFTPTQKGVFTIYCDIEGHREGGQVGTMIVE